MGGGTEGSLELGTCGEAKEESSGRVSAAGGNAGSSRGGFNTSRRGRPNPTEFLDAWAPLLLKIPPFVRREADTAFSSCSSRFRERARIQREQNGRRLLLIE